MACLPFWHNDLLRLSTERVPSGCSRSGMNIACAPEDMRAAAEKWLNARGLWRGVLPMDVYALARNIASEVGSGSPEEKVAVAEATMGRAEVSGTDVSAVLIYRAPGTLAYGYFGAIGEGGIGRWSSTVQDPTVADVEIARRVLAGETYAFAQGADDQVGPDQWDDEKAYANVRGAARGGAFWVGPLPGVNPWHTFLTREGRGWPAEIAVAELRLLRAWKGAKLDWSELPVCRRPIPGPAVITAGLLVGIGMAWLASGRPTSWAALRE